jgi:Acetyltransferase (GNAT) domain
VTDDIVVRQARANDRPQILALVARILGWGMDSRNEALFAWKHEHNVFGPSPAWVALDGDHLAGFRTFLRWEFELGGTPIRAARAVDTATDHAYQRRGVFRRLTLLALEELEVDGPTFVFNTPNDQSRPGYLSMGWQVSVGSPWRRGRQGCTGSLEWPLLEDRPSSGPPTVRAVSPRQRCSKTIDGSRNCSTHNRDLARWSRDARWSTCDGGMHTRRWNTERPL